MGRRGPVPKRSKASTKPADGPPEAPDDLDGEALLEWQRVVAETPTLSRSDRAALLAYCQAWAQMQEAHRNIVKTGTIIKLPNGYPGATPYLKVFNDAARLCLKYQTEFGLTPTARARIPSAAPTDDEPARIEI